MSSRGDFFPGDQSQRFLLVGRVTRLRGCVGDISCCFPVASPGHSPGLWECFEGRILQEGSSV